MANIFWSGVSVSFQSALATSVAITGISKASPGVVTHSGTDPSDGDYVLLTVEGMNQVNSRVFRVANVVASTSFELEGEDTTLYNTFSSGTFEVITFGNSLTTITNVSPSGGEPEFADTTTIHDTIRQQVPTITSALSFAMTTKYDPSNAGLIALNAASKSISQRAFLFTFTTGAKLVFNGYVSFPQVPTGAAQGLVDSPITITADNIPTNYAT